VERGVVRWGGKGFTVVEREEVRKKKEHGRKKTKEIGAEKPDGLPVPTCWMWFFFSGAGSTVVQFGTGYSCQFAG